MKRDVKHGFPLPALELVAAGLLLAACSGSPAPTSAPSGSAPSGSASSPVSAAPESTSATPASEPATSPTKARSQGLLSSEDLSGFAEDFGDSAAVSVQDLTGGQAVRTGDTRTPYAWSTIKVLIVARVLADAGGPGGLTAEQRALVERALSRSDNDAAAALYRELEARHGGLTGAARAMDQVLRDSGDDATRVSTVGRDGFSTYGQTRWTVGAQTRFLAALARHCILTPDSDEYILEAMSGAVSDQRWGLGHVDSPAFKGGWGPDPDGRYLVRQFGLVAAPDGHRYVVALTGRPRDGSFEAGKELNTRIARWVADHVTDAPAERGCS